MRRSRILLLLVALYLAVIFLGNLPDHLILFPTTAPLDTHGAIRKLLPFQKGELELWTARSQLAQQIGRAEIFVLRFYGNADRADRWVASAGDRPVVLFGASLGTAAALHVTAHRPVAGLILHNPVALRPVILRQFGWWNLWLLAGPVALRVPRDLDSVANAKAIRAPAIFLLAEQDEIVAPRYHRLVVDAYGGEKRVIALPGAHHNSPIEGAALADLYKALDWLLPRSTEH